jgi:uncharacterized membrane protein (GlpM family)
MQTVIRMAAVVAIVLIATALGRKAPSLSGLIATMPLVGLIVLVWLYADNPGDRNVATGYARGALWGVLPTMLFFLAVYLSLKRALPFPAALAIGSLVWLAGAIAHQLLLR